MNYKEKSYKDTNVKDKKNATKQSMVYWRNQKGNQKTPEDKWKWKYNNPNLMGHIKTSSLPMRGVYNDTGLPQETRKISNLTLYLKEPEKEKTNPKLVEGKK